MESFEPKPVVPGMIALSRALRRLHVTGVRFVSYDWFIGLLASRP